MPELLAAALPVLVPALLPGLLLLLAPLCGRFARSLFAALFCLAALGFVVDVLVIDHGQVHALTVPNLFPRGPQAELHRWDTEVVAAPAWHYHLWIAGMLLLPAIVLFARRGRARAAPSPALHAASVFCYYLLLRLGLEKTAAPEGVVWSTGGTMALLVVLPFCGWYCGRRGLGFRRFLGQLLQMALLQRLVLVAVAFVATTQHLGTHLDTHVVEDISLPGIGELHLSGDVARWLYPTCIPQLTLWVVVTLVAGIGLGWPLCWLAQRSLPAAGALPQ